MVSAPGCISDYKTGWATGLLFSAGAKSVIFTRIDEPPPTRWVSRLTAHCCLNWDGDAHTQTIDCHGTGARHGAPLENHDKLSPYLFRRVRKITIRHCQLHVRPSSCNNSAPTDGFWWNLTFECFSNICRENSSFIKIRQEKRVLYMKTFWRLWRYLAELFLDWEMFQIKVVKNKNTFYVQ